MAWKSSPFLFSAFCFFSLNTAFSQTAPGKYFIPFTDKNASPFSIYRPQDYLSPRALERRQKQNILIDSLDLPVSPEYLKALENAGARVLHASKWFNGATIQTDSPAVLDAIYKLPFVRANIQKPTYSFTQGDYAYKANMEMEFCTPEKAQYGDAYLQLQMLQGDALHCEGLMGEGMHIAVLDAGFYKVDSLKAFEKLRNEGRILGTRDFVDGDAFVYEINAHGTYVLSAMAGFLPGSIIGTAPNASYYLFRTEDIFSEYRIEEDNWVAAAELADSLGVDIINSSLGYTIFDDASQNYTYNDLDGNTARVTIGANIAATRGILVVNSAGNYGLGPWHYIGTPADGPGVFSVGAVNREGKFAEFSSRGPTADGRIKPNVVAVGAQSTVISLEEGETIRANGTSFSSPIMAGMAACLWQAFPYKKNKEIMAAIIQSGSNYNALNNNTGAGIPDFKKAFLFLKQSEALFADNKEPVFLYPNPFNEFLQLAYKLQEGQELVLEIYNGEGQLMLRHKQQAEPEVFNRIYLSEVRGFSQGLYFARLRFGNQIKTFKLIKAG
jgi:serine protease AprX